MDTIIEFAALVRAAWPLIEGAIAMALLLLAGAVLESIEHGAVTPLWS